MSVDTIMAEIGAAHRQKIIDICQEGRLVGSVVRNFYVVGQTWGMVKSLVLVGDELKLKAGDRQDWGHDPFESMIVLDNGTRLIEESDGCIIIVGKGLEHWTEWKFTLPT